LKIQKKEIVLAEVPVCHVCIDSPMRVDEEVKHLNLKILER